MNGNDNEPPNKKTKLNDNSDIKTFEPKIKIHTKRFNPPSQFKRSNIIHSSSNENNTLRRIKKLERKKIKKLLKENKIKPELSEKNKIKRENEMKNKLFLGDIPIFWNDKSVRKMLKKYKDNIKRINFGNVMTKGKIYQLKKELNNKEINTNISTKNCWILFKNNDNFDKIITEFNGKKYISRNKEYIIRMIMLINLNKIMN